MVGQHIVYCFNNFHIFAHLLIIYVFTYLHKYKFWWRSDGIYALSDFLLQATGLRIGVLIQSFATMITALIVAFVFVWELTLVMLIFMPIMVLSGKMQASLLRGYSKNDKEGVEDGGKVGL